jgi:hypothetical protein
MKEAKAELQARGVIRAEGDLFTVTRSDAIRIMIDTTAVREAMGQKWCDDHLKMANVASFRVTVERAAVIQLAA